MSETNDCYGLADNANTLDNAAREIENNAKMENAADKASRGEQTVDDIMKPIRDAKEAEKTATGAEKAKLVDEIHSHYAEGKGASNTERTKETRDISKAIQADSDVKEYIQSMSAKDFGVFRTELSDVFGANQAAMAERQYAINKWNSLESELSNSNKMVPSIQDRIDTARSRGVMSDADLNTMRGLEDLLSMSDDAISKGKSRNTYNALKRTLGDDIAQDVFKPKIEAKIEELNTKLQDSNFASKLMKTAPTKEELEMIDNITSGARKMDASSLEFVEKLLDKMNSNGLSEVLKTTDALNELDKGTRGRIYANAGTSWSSKKKLAAGVGAPIAFAAVGLPLVLNGWGMFGLVNSGEMASLFGQFDKDQTSERLREVWFPKDGIRKEAADLWKQGVDGYISMMDGLYDIPLYGKWLEATTFVGYGSAKSGLGNLERVMTTLEDKGLATRDESSTTGWRETTNAEKMQLYTSDPGKLYKNDSEFIKDNSPWKGSTDVFDGNKELRPEEAMALYYMERGDINRDDFLKSGGDLSDLNNEPLMTAVREYGREHDASETETTQETQPGPNSVRTREEYIERVMEKNPNWDRERAESFVDGKIDEMQWKSRIYDRQNLTEEEAIAKIYTGDATLGSSSGGSGGSRGSGESSKSSNVQSETEMKAKQIREGEAATKERVEPIVRETKQEGKVDIAKVKEMTDDKVGISDMAEEDRAGTIAGFENYAKEMKSGAGDEEQQAKNKADYEQMKAIDKKAAGEAMMERYGCTI